MWCGRPARSLSRGVPPPQDCAGKMPARPRAGRPHHIFNVVAVQSDAEAPMLTQISAWVFDAYGTLFDPLSVQGKAERLFPGRGEALSRLWRSRQLEYTWLRSLMNRYADFWQVTQEALVFACRSLSLPCHPAEQAELMQEYFRLEVYPDVTSGLEALRGWRLAILSNGSPRMLKAVVEHAGLKPAFAALLSADTVRTYKPSPAVYQMAVGALKLQKSEIGFVSSNYWDAAGAAAFGFPAFWLTRTKAAPEELGIAPQATLTGLHDLAGLC
jgi:2-haloacid dehalogenase